MTLLATASVLLGAIACASALSPPLPGVHNFPNSPNSLIANTTVQSPKNGPQGPSTKYIIQFHPESISGGDTDPHASFHQRAHGSGLSYATRHVYNNSGIFVGLSIDLDNGGVDDLRALDNVAHVWPVRTIGRPLAVAGSPAGQGKSAYVARSHSTATSVQIPKITGNVKPNNPQKMTGVDKVHDMGYYGAGVKIAAIDTGVDYTHPSLGGCFGKKCKISFGYDFVGDNYPNTTVEGPKPLTQCLAGGHGTHVMGIIGMEDPDDIGFGLQGVAPKAELGMYRVFGCSGETETDIIVAAMLRAQTDGADIITMSLGSAVQDESEDPMQNVTTALSQSGMAIFAAAGNDAGLYGLTRGMYFTSSPASGPDVFSVGSVDNSVYPVVYQVKDSEGMKLQYSSVMPLDGPEKGLTVLVVNRGSSSELDLQGCYAEDYISAAASVTNPSKYILAVLNGGCLSAAKGQAAKEYGFNYILSYYVDGYDLPYIWSEFDVVDPSYDFDITPIILNKDDSKTLLKNYAKDPHAYKLFFDGDKYAATSPAYDHGGFMSNYSSWGPLMDSGDNKPQLSAPGANILSTWPLDNLNKGYAILSGTSMSTPFMAASFALLKEAFPKKSNTELMNSMQSSGTLTKWYYDQIITAPAFQQGAGMLNLHNAMTWQTTVTPAQIALDTSGNGHPVKSRIKIHNRSDKSKTYSFSHTPAALGMWEYLQGPMNQLYSAHAAVNFHQESIRIPAGEMATVSLTVDPPYVDDPIYLPIYSGYISIRSGQESHTVPYIGQPWNTAWPETIISEWSSEPVRYDGTFSPGMLKTPSIHGYGVYTLTATFTSTELSTNATFTMGKYGYFGVLWQLEETASYVRFDLVPTNTSFVPTIYGFDPNVVAIPDSQLVYPTTANITNVLGVPVVYNLKEFAGPVDNLDADLSWWQYELDKQAVPDADYRVLMRVLPQGGKPKKPQDYQSWLSAILSIDRSAPDQPALPLNEIYNAFMPTMHSA